MTTHKGPYCGAKLLKRDGTCTLAAGWGTDHSSAGHCRKHLGSTPNGNRAAAREMVVEQARRQRARMDAPPVTNPFAALRRLAGFAEAWRESCASLVNELTPDQVRYEGKLHGEMLRAEIGMLQDAMRQSAAILTSLAKLDIETAWQALEQAKAAMVADAFHAALTRAGLAPERAALVSADFSRRLRVFSDEEEQAGEVLTGVVIPPRR